MGERLNTSNNTNDDWQAPGLSYPPSEWVYNHTDVKPQEVDRFAPQPTGLYANAEQAWGDMSEEEQRANLEKQREDRETAQGTVESILAKDEQMLQNVEKIAFDDNIRAEFLNDYNAATLELINKYSGDYSEQASEEVNAFIGDYCAVIMTMDNLQRAEGQRLLDVASNGDQITSEIGGLEHIVRFMQQRRKNGCNVDIPVPIQYSEDNPHPKLDGVVVTNWLEQRLGQKEIDTTDSTNTLKEQVTTKLTGKTAYQRFQERMAARRNANQ